MDRTRTTPLDRAIVKAGTQALLAREVGCTQQAISAARKAGRPSPALAIKIALYLGEAPDVLWPGLFSLRSGEAA